MSGRLIHPGKANAGCLRHNVTVVKPPHHHHQDDEDGLVNIINVMKMLGKYEAVSCCVVPFILSPACLGIYIMDVTSSFFSFHDPLLPRPTVSATASVTDHINSDYVGDEIINNVQHHRVVVLLSIQQRHRCFIPLDKSSASTIPTYHSHSKKFSSPATNHSIKGRQDKIRKILWNHSTRRDETR